jgi:hypothetical protein
METGAADGMWTVERYRRWLDEQRHLAPPQRADEDEAPAPAPDRAVSLPPLAAPRSAAAAAPAPQHAAAIPDGAAVIEIDDDDAIDDVIAQLSNRSWLARWGPATPDVIETAGAAERRRGGPRPSGIVSGRAGSTGSRFPSSSSRNVIQEGGTVLAGASWSTRPGTGSLGGSCSPLSGPRPRGRPGELDAARPWQAEKMQSGIDFS